jgi:hypothetical protein
MEVFAYLLWNLLKYFYTGAVLYCISGHDKHVLAP